MARFENKQKISHITMQAEARCFCPLGNAWYTNKLEIKIVPDETIPDYCEVENWLTSNIDGKHLIIEDVVAMVYGYMREQYEPFDCMVKSVVTDAAHGPVIVEKY